MGESLGLGLRAEGYLTTEFIAGSRTVIVANTSKHDYTPKRSVCIYIYIDVNMILSAHCPPTKTLFPIKSPPLSPLLLKRPCMGSRLSLRFWVAVTEPKSTYPTMGI